jgi:hypothetical protein
MKGNVKRQGSGFCATVEEQFFNVWKWRWETEERTAISDQHAFNWFWEDTRRYVGQSTRRRIWEAHGFLLTWEAVL